VMVALLSWEAAQATQICELAAVPLARWTARVQVSPAPETVNPEASLQAQLTETTSRRLVPAVDTESVAGDDNHSICLVTGNPESSEMVVDPEALTVNVTLTVRGVLLAPVLATLTVAV
jgi:hypothetical protein